MSAVSPGTLEQALVSSGHPPFTIPLPRRRDDEQSIAMTIASSYAEETSAEVVKILNAVVQKVHADKQDPLDDWWGEVLKPLLDLEQQSEELSPADCFRVYEMLAKVYLQTPRQLEYKRAIELCTQMESLLSKYPEKPQGARWELLKKGCDQMLILAQDHIEIPGYLFNRFCEVFSTARDWLAEEHSTPFEIASAQAVVSTVRQILSSKVSQGLELDKAEEALHSALGLVQTYPMQIASPFSKLAGIYNTLASVELGRAREVGRQKDSQTKHLFREIGSRIRYKKSDTAADFAGRIQSMRPKDEQQQARKDTGLALICTISTLEQQALSHLEKAWMHYRAGWDACKSQSAKQLHYQEGKQELKVHSSLAIHYLGFLLRCHEPDQPEYLLFLKKYQHNLPDLFTLCCEALCDHPQSFELHYILARIHRLRKDFAAAETQCIRDCFKIAKDPIDKIRALEFAADTCISAHRHKTAQIYLQDANKLEERSWNFIPRSKKLLQIRLGNLLSREKEKILKAALTCSIKDPDRAIRLFQQIEEHYFYPDENYPGLSAEDRCAVLLRRAEVYLDRGQPKDQALAWQDLFQVKDWLTPLKSDTSQLQSTRRRLIARINIANKKLPEANAQFEKAWTLYRNRDLAIAFLAFLIDQQEFERALTVVKEAYEAIDPELHYWKAKIYFKMGKWAQVKESGDRLLRLRTTQRTLKAMQLEVADLAIQACHALQNPPEEIDPYLEAAYVLDPSSRCIERFQQLRNYQEKRIQEMLEDAYFLPAAEAIKVVEHLLSHPKTTPSERCRIQLLYAEMEIKLEQFSVAHTRLQQILPETPQHCAERCRFLAQIAVHEGEVEEAARYFNQGFTDDPLNRLLAIEAIEFFIDRDLKRAWQICDRHFTMSAPSRREYRLPLMLRLQHSIQARQYLYAGDYSQAALYASEAYELATADEFFEQAELLTTVLREQTIEEHLQDLLSSQRVDRFPTAAYLTSLYATHQDELQERPHLHLQLLFLRAQRLVTEGVDPMRDYNAALSVIDSSASLKSYRQIVQHYISLAKSETPLTSIRFLDLSTLKKVDHK